PEPGDVLAVFDTGAYNFSMASNYNRIPRPAMVLVHQGRHELMVRRETYADLVARDVVPSWLAAATDGGAAGGSTKPELATGTAGGGNRSMMISDFRLDVLILRVAAVLLALAIHEYAHAAAAVRLGDPGPKFDGRLTLNPLAHLDPVGTLMLFFFSFGWAKPVMVNPARFKNPRRDMMWVALAGPLSNIALAFALARLAPFILNIVPPGALRATWMFLQVSVQLNIWL